jgi:hypothetical protein
MTRQIISANRLNDGIVVYLTDGGDWAEAIAAARVIDSEEALTAALEVAAAAVARQLVVDPYPIQIDESEERRPTRFREYIRARGPTVRPDLGKQAVTG